MISKIFTQGGGAGIGSYVLVFKDGVLAEGTDFAKVRGAYDSGDSIYFSVSDDTATEALIPASGWIGENNELHLVARDFDDGKTYSVEVGENAHDADVGIKDGIELGEGDVAGTSIIADPYDGEKAYPAGSYVIYDGKLLKSNTACEPSEIIDLSQWDEVKIADELGQGGGGGGDLPTPTLAQAGQYLIVNDQGGFEIGTPAQVDGAWLSLEMNEANELTNQDTIERLENLPANGDCREFWASLLWCGRNLAFKVSAYRDSLEGGWFYIDTPFGSISIAHDSSIIGAPYEVDLNGVAFPDSKLHVLEIYATVADAHSDIVVTRFICDSNPDGVWFEENPKSFIVHIQLTNLDVGQSYNDYFPVYLYSVLNPMVVVPSEDDYYQDLADRWEIKLTSSQDDVAAPISETDGVNDEIIPSSGDLEDKALSVEFHSLSCALVSNLLEKTPVWICLDTDSFEYFIPSFGGNQLFPVQSSGPSPDPFDPSTLPVIRFEGNAAYFNAPAPDPISSDHAGQITPTVLLTCAGHTQYGYVTDMTGNSVEVRLLDDDFNRIPARIVLTYQDEPDYYTFVIYTSHVANVSGTEFTFNLDTSNSTISDGWMGSTSVGGGR